MGSVAMPDYPREVALSGNHAYVSDGFAGIYVIDVTDPTSPQVVGSVDTADFAWGAVVSGELTYVSDGGRGLRILPAQCEPEATAVTSNSRHAELLSVWPNPALRGVSFHFSMRALEGASLHVHDVRGRRVRSLVTRSRGGEQDVVWDGMDDHGRPLASGAYFVRLHWPGGAETSRVTLLR
jgi:hypothetical protein